MYKLETENFSLELLPGIHQDNFPYPKANSLQVKVSSLGFSADSIMVLWILMTLLYLISR